MLIRTTVSLCALALGVLLASCSFAPGRSGFLGPLPAARYDLWELDIIPSTGEGVSAILPIERDLVVIERVEGDPQRMSLSRVRRPNTKVWSSSLAAPPSLAGIDFTTNTAAKPRSAAITAMGFIEFGDFSYGIEAPLLLREHDGRVLLASYRVGENDSVYAITRQFDAATGREISASVIARLPDEVLAVGRGLRITAALTAGGETFVLTWAREAEHDDDIVEQSALVARFDGTIIRRLTHFSPDEDQTMPVVGPANDGGLYFVSIAERRTLRVISYGAAGDSVRVDLPLGLSVDDRELTIDDFHGYVLADGSLLLGTLATDFGDAMAVQLHRFDRTLRHTQIVTHAVSEELLERTIGSGTIPDCVLDRLLVTTTPSARYLFVLESRDYTGESGSSYMGGHTSPPQFEADELVLLAFDDAGRPTWQSGLDKSSTIIDGNFWQFNTPSLRTGGDTLDLLFRTNDALKLHRFSLADGSRLAPVDGVELLEHTTSGGEYMRSIVWTGPTAFVAATERPSGAALLMVDVEIPPDTTVRASGRR